MPSGRQQACGLRPLSRGRFVCELAALVLAAVAVRGFDASPPAGLAFVGFIIAAVVTAGQWLAGHAVTIAVTVAKVAWMIAQALATFGKLVGGVFLKVYGALDRFYSGVLRPFVSWAWRSIESLAGWLKRITLPLVKLLERFREEILAFYEKYVRPVLLVVDALRATVRVLALARVEFAEELDRQLARVEQAILWPLREAMTRLNEAMDYINRVVTLDGLLQRKALIESLWRDAGLAWTVLINSAARQRAAPGDGSGPRGDEPKPLGAIRRDVAAVLVDGSGPYAGYVAEWSRQWADDIAAATTTGG